MGFLHAFRFRQRFVQLQKRSLGALPLLTNHERDWLSAATRDRTIPVEVVLLWRAVANVEMQAMEKHGVIDDSPLSGDSEPLSLPGPAPTLRSLARRTSIRVYRRAVGRTEKQATLAPEPPQKAPCSNQNELTWNPVELTSQYLWGLKDIVRSHGETKRTHMETSQYVWCLKRSENLD